MRCCNRYLFRNSEAGTCQTEEQKYQAQYRGGQEVSLLGKNKTRTILLRVMLRRRAERVAICLVVAAILCVFCSCPAVSASSASAGDIVAARVTGLFKLRDAAGGVRCASTVRIRGDLQNSSSGQPAFQVPHANIDHDSATCTTAPGMTSSAMAIYTADPTRDIQEVARIMPNVVKAGALFARDESGRVCGTWKIPETSVFVFLTPSKEFKFDSNILKHRKIDPLPSEKDYMLVIFPYGGGQTGDGNPVCIYQKDSQSLSSEPLATIPYKEPEKSSGNQEVDAGASPDAAAENAVTSWWSPGHIGIVAGAGGAVLLALLAIVGLVVIRRRRRASEDAYYQFDGRSSVRNSGSVAGTLQNKPSSLMTPWQIRRSKKALPEEEDETQPAALEDRPEIPVAGRRGAVPMRESIDSTISSEIAAPMMSQLEIQRLSTQANGIGLLDNNARDRDAKSSQMRRTFKS